MDPAVFTNANPPPPTHSETLQSGIEQLVRRFDHTKQVQALQVKLKALNDKFWSIFVQNDRLERENRALHFKNMMLEKQVEELERRVQQGIKEETIRLALEDIAADGLL
jgi:predicted nuclease with TOPRIM domain